MSNAAKLQENPFYILGVTPRDSDEAILSQALQIHLLTGEDTEEARNTLLSPKSRLAAEIGFLPRAEAAEIAKLREYLEQIEGGRTSENGAPLPMPALDLSSALAELNGAAALLEGWPVTDDFSAAALCRSVACAAGGAQLLRVFSDLNADRRAGGREEADQIYDVSVLLKEHLDALKTRLYQRCQELSLSEFHQARLQLVKTFQDPEDPLYRSPFLGELICDVLSGRFTTNVEEQKELMGTIIREYWAEAEETNRKTAAQKDSSKRMNMITVQRRYRQEKTMELERALRLWHNMTLPEREIRKTKGVVSQDVRELCDRLHGFVCDIFNRERDLLSARPLICALDEVFTDAPLAMRELIRKNRRIICRN